MPAFAVNGFIAVNINSNALTSVNDYKNFTTGSKYEVVVLQNTFYSVN